MFFHAAEHLGVGSEDAELLRHVMCWLEDKSAFGVVLLARGPEYCKPKGQTDGKSLLKCYVAGENCTAVIKLKVLHFLKSLREKEYM